MLFHHGSSVELLENVVSSKVALIFWYSIVGLELGNLRTK